MLAVGALVILFLSTGCVSQRGDSGPPGNTARKSTAFTNRTYVVTGASSGFGRGVAVELGRKGANVVLAARRRDLLEEVAAEVRQAGGRALVVRTDVASASDMNRLATAAVSEFGRIDAWINNAGVGVIGRFWDAPVEDYSRLVDVNLKGVIYGSHAAIRQFRKQGHGTLVNVGSIDSQVPLAYQAAYSATKAGVLGLGRALNEELRLARMRSIRVATIMPWAADTPWWPHAANYSGRNPRMAGMDDPSKIVNAIIRATVHPREEMPVGWKAQASYASHRVFPNLTESLSANIAHREMLKAAPTAPTSGTLHTPMPAGREVDGGVRERMKREDAERAADRTR